MLFRLGAVRVLSAEVPEPDPDPDPDPWFAALPEVSRSGDEGGEDEIGDETIAAGPEDPLRRA